MNWPVIVYTPIINRTAESLTWILIGAIRISHFRKLDYFSVMACLKNALSDMISCTSSRSSCLEVFYRKGILGNPAKFTGNSLKFLPAKTSTNNRSSHQRCSVWKGACNFVKKETLTEVFSCEFLWNFWEHLIYRTPPEAASVPQPS